MCNNRSAEPDEFVVFSAPLLSEEIWSASSVMMRIKAVTPAQHTGGQAVTALQKKRG